MKHSGFHRTIVAIAMMLIGWQPSLAHDFEVNGIFYKKTSNNTVAVTYKGDFDSSYSNEYVGDVVIPSSVNYNGTTYSVTSIGEWAFDGCSSLASIEIPNSVTSIVRGAFYDCAGLISIEIPNSVTSIGDKAFSSCLSLTSVIWNSVRCSDFDSDFYNTPFRSCPNITSFTFGDEVEHIPAYLCYNLSSLTSIEIPNSVTSIGNSAFYRCSSLTSVVIGNSVTSIGEWAFRNCDSLTSVIWNSVRCSDFSYYINNPFENCPNITSFTFGDEVEHIPAYLCYDLSSLTSVVIGNSVTSIGEWAFRNCDSLTSVVWNAIKCSDFDSYDIPFENCPNITSFTFGDEVEHIPAYLCYHLSKLPSIQIPNSVTSIGSGAFFGCSSLTSVVILNSVTSIGEYAFCGCSSLPSIQIPNSVTSIGDYAFYYCTSLTSIEIPNSVTSIGSGAFFDCSSLTSVEIGNSVTSIGIRAFAGCDSLTSFAVDADNTKYDSRNGCIAIIETASNTLVAGCQNTIIPNSVTSIGNGAFSCCKSLTSIEIPNSVTSIGDEAFSYCAGLTSIEIPNSVTSIGDEAFSYCAGLTSIEIPNSVTSIGDEAFSYCAGLTSIEIPNSVTSIGGKAFYDCSSLTKITCLATNPPTIKSDTFIRYSAELYVPVGCISAYQSAIFWRNFNIKEIPTLSTSIALNKTSASLKATETITLIATVLPENATDKSVTWKSSNEAVATVDANGLVTAIGVGETTITATTTDGSNLTASCKVTVVPTLAESITLDKTEISLEATETATLNATILPELTTNKSVTWTSSNEAVSTVDENGVVTAVAVGEATITATTVDNSNLSASCKVTIVPTLAVSIELDQTEASVEEKSEFQLTATVLPEHATNKEVAWSSSDKWVASVDNTGLVTMYSAGEVVITATTTDGTNLSASCYINVYSSDIDGVEGDDLIVATIGDNIVVKNAQLGSNVRVYAADGSIISSEVATDGDVVVEAPIKGVYIVSVNGKTFKVMVK